MLGSGAVTGRRLDLTAMKRMRSTPILLLALLLMAGCGGGSHSGGGPSATSGPGNTSGANAMADFATCMREHGQNLPDPDPNAPNQVIAPPSGGSSSRWNAAMQACRHFLPGGGGPQTPEQGELDGLRAYAVCMREHGIEVTDPDPNTGQSSFGGRLASADRATIQNDPEYKAADAACQNTLVTSGSK